jgi:uncharacterized HAD superfamily protein
MRGDQARFCIDIDNVVARTDEVMRRVISHFSQGKVCLDYEHITNFNYYECADGKGNRITKSDWNQIHNLFSEPGVLMNIAPIPGAIEGLHRLAEHGRIHLVTTRLRKARKPTVEWLEMHEFPENDLHFLKHGEKHVTFKPFTAAVEDDYDQAVSFSAVAATPSFLIRHPWNRNRPANRGIQWVDNWPELVDRLVTLSAS